MNEKESAFLHQVVPAAQASMRLCGVPASITIAQAILESEWGGSALAREANNFFGIKAEHYAQPDSYVALPTTEYEDGARVWVTADFAKYASASECFADHGLLLARAPRYAPAMAVRRDPAAFAAELQRCGYSTSPKYANELMELVKEFDLTQYDPEEVRNVAV